MAALGLTIASGIAVPMTATALAPVAQAPIPAVLFPAEVPFNAPLCAGTTTEDPTDTSHSDGNPQYEEAISDLTRVFGARLAAYNSGQVVPLYDSYGVTVEAYPPLCGTRYVEGVGPVSEWMFCTDLNSLVCGGVDEDGNLLGQVQDADGNFLVNGMVPPSDHSLRLDTEVVPPQSALDGTNPKLSVDQEKVIAYLIQHGFPYEGVGNQAWDNVTFATSGEGSSERAALQTLIWCVSDWVPGSTGSYFRSTCAANMNQDVQNEILSMIPTDPVLELHFDNPTQTIEVGQTATYELTTNVFNQPIELTTAGPVTVCTSSAGVAEIIDGSLIVTGTDTATAITIELCATSAEPGDATIEVSATPPSTSHISWSQSQREPGEDPCQVFATFNEDDKFALSDVASATWVEVATPTEEPTDEPTDGSPDEPTDESTDDPTDDPTDESTDDSTDEPTEEPTDKPTDESTDDSSDDTKGSDDTDDSSDDTEGTTGTDTDTLPKTGADLLPLLGVTLLSIALGTTALVIRRRNTVS